MSGDRSETQLKRAAASIESRQDEIRSLAQELEDDLAAISSDNAQLAQEAKALHLQMRTLSRFTVLLARLDELLTAQSGDTEILFVVRQRRRDLLMQLAVATQAHAAVSRLERSNAQVLRAMRQASRLMLTALHTSGLAVHALEVEGSVDAALGGAQLLNSLDDVDEQRKSSLSNIHRAGSMRA